MNFTFMQLIIMFLIVYVCLYALVDRIMKCIEHCATARAYGRFKEAGVMIKMDDVAGGIAKSKEEKDNTEHVLEYYEKWQNDELDMDKLKEDLWVYGGVRLEEVEGK